MVLLLKTLAVIPARGGSKRLPGKNMRSFLGVPLIGWSIRFAQKMDRFDKIVVSTDSEEIARASRSAGNRGALSAAGGACHRYRQFGGGRA